MYRKLVENSGAEAVLITDPVNMRYYSGFAGGEGAVYLSKNRQVLITDSRYTEAAAKESSFEVIEEGLSHKRTEILAECLEKDGAASLAYEDQSMTCSDFFRLQEALPQVKEWVRLKSTADDLRRIKTPEEIKNIAAAAAIADKAFSEMMKILKVGMTEKEAAAQLEFLMKKFGADGTSFDTIFASGIHSSMPHAVPTDKKIEEGDFVTMDFGCKVNGYCSDMTRTVVMGKATDKQKEVYNTVLEANERAMAQVKAGVVGKDIDAIARDYIKEAGYGEYFGHGLGHSVGLYIHENPRFSPSEDSVIEANVTETVEPGIYIPGWGGVRIEDLIVVKEDGYELLSHSPKQLIEL